MALLWLIFGLCAFAVSLSSSSASRFLIAAMALSVSVIAVWSALDRTFWEGQGPRWWIAVALVAPVLLLGSGSSRRIGEDGLFTASVAVFLSMSSGLFGLHDLWTPVVVILAGAIAVVVTPERSEGLEPAIFQRYVGFAAALVAIAWVPVFLTQPVAA